MSAPPDIHAFDIEDTAYVQRIFEVFAEMNRQGPVTRAHTHGGHWVVTGYDAIRGAALDWEGFTSTQGVMHPQAGPADMPPITTDPPVQQAYRKLVMPFFSPSAATVLEPSIRAHAAALIDAFVADGRADLSLQFAEPLIPLVFLDDLVHAPADLRDRFLADTVGHGATPDEHTKAIVSMVDELVALFEGRIDGEPLSDEQIVKVTTILLVGGTDTTRNVIASGLWFLAEQPELRARLLADTRLLRPAVEEMLRLFGSVQLMGRTVTRETELGGARMCPGDKVVLAPAAANRDPAEFPDAERFDLERSANRHIAFGVGVHRCLGSNLARLEIRVALEEILRRLPDYTLAEGYSYRRRRGHVHGPESLDVTFTPGTPQEAP